MRIISRILHPPMSFSVMGRDRENEAGLTSQAGAGFSIDKSRSGAIAVGSGDQHVAAWQKAAPDLCDDGRLMRAVLKDEDRKDTSERRVREARRALTSCTSNVASTLSRAARVLATSTMRGDPSTPTTS